MYVYVHKFVRFMLRVQISLNKTEAKQRDDNEGCTWCVAVPARRNFTGSKTTRTVADGEFGVKG